MSAEKGDMVLLGIDRVFYGNVWSKYSPADIMEARIAGWWNGFQEVSLLDMDENLTVISYNVCNECIINCKF